MVESDQRKAVFLRTALRELSLEGTVISDRIEKIATLEADILSARALADLPTLLGFASVHMKKDGTALFPKGEGWRKEEKLAQNHWSYNCEPISSTTHNQAVVLRIKDISRV
ncbi:Ribosomal RNA small subunit methyltransferase G [Sulfitobacter noctilucicola]|nr:Ribosomal RNA small subunit methyltransferase G [Sulfitobacter noctilucicola]